MWSSSGTRRRVGEVGRFSRPLARSRQPDSACRISQVVLVHASPGQSRFQSLHSVLATASAITSMQSAITSMQCMCIIF
jgi:hypothetical protein